MNTSNASDTDISFAERVYRAVRQVPKGSVTTYKDVANHLDSAAYRAVGTALKNNPDAPYTPCHRVIKTDRSLGGFFGHTAGPEVERKKELLIKEGISFEKNGKVRKEHLHEF